MSNVYLTIATPATEAVADMNSDAKVIVSDQHKVYPAFQGEDGCVVIDADLHDKEVPLKVTQDIRQSMTWYGDSREAAQEAADVLNARFDYCQFAVQEIQ